MTNDLWLEEKEIVGGEDAGERVNNPFCESQRLELIEETWEASAKRWNPRSDARR
jgi:phage terminase large subunit